MLRYTIIFSLVDKNIAKELGIQTSFFISKEPKKVNSHFINNYYNVECVVNKCTEIH